MGYLGCYKDSSTRDLSLYEVDKSTMTIDLCRTTCHSQGYLYPGELIDAPSFLHPFLPPPIFCSTIWKWWRYAGLQYSTQCYCGNSYGSLGVATASDCNMDCAGDSTELCGGAYLIFSFCSHSSLLTPIVALSSLAVSSFSLNCVRYRNNVYTSEATNPGF